MLFFKETAGYKLVSLLDEAKIKRKYINIILFIINFYKFRISKKLLIKRKSTNKKKIELFIELFKERFYLEQLVKTNYIETDSKLRYMLSNNILISEILYTNNLRFNIEYTLSEDKYSIYIIGNGRAFNVTEDNLKIESISEIFEHSLYILFSEWEIIVGKLFTNYIKEAF